MNSISVIKNKSGQFEARKATPEIGGENFARFNPNESSIKNAVSYLHGDQNDYDRIVGMLKTNGYRIGQY